MRTYRENEKWQKGVLDAEGRLAADHLVAAQRRIGVAVQRGGVTGHPERDHRQRRASRSLVVADIIPYVMTLAEPVHHVDDAALVDTGHIRSEQDLSEHQGGHQPRFVFAAWMCLKFRRFRTRGFGR